jgi:hypothetical protein
MPNRIRPDLPPGIPDNMAMLPVDERGYPVPWFVEWIEGRPDFRVTSRLKMYRAVKFDLCWTCGKPMGTKRRAYVSGPMCSVNRTNGEPPSHVACATWSAIACPFLSKPAKHRREEGLPDEGQFHPGAILRNPGAMVVWVTRGTKIKFADRDGLLFDLGEPERVEWYARGRPATREEVEASIASGLPLLREAAAKDGPEAQRQMEAAIQAALPLLPA